MNSRCSGVWAADTMVGYPDCSCWWRSTHCAVALRTVPVACWQITAGHCILLPAPPPPSTAGVWYTDQLLAEGCTGATLYGVI